MNHITTEGEPIPLAQIQDVLEHTAQQLINWEKQFRKAYGLDAEFLQQQLKQPLQQTRGRLRLQPKNNKIFTTIEGLEYGIRVNSTNDKRHLPFSLSLNYSSTDDNRSLTLAYRDTNFEDLGFLSLHGFDVDAIKRQKGKIDTEKRLSVIEVRPNPRLEFQYEGSRLVSWDAEIWSNSLGCYIQYINGKPLRGYLDDTDGFSLIYTSPELAAKHPKNMEHLPTSIIPYNPIALITSFPEQLARLLPAE